MTTDARSWPPLPLDDWQDTLAALHLRTQIVGKTRLALEPTQNHWWHTALYLTARGLSTSPMPCGDRTVEIQFDFYDHQIVVCASDGSSRAIPLTAQSVAEFYRAYVELLASLDIHVKIWPVPSEVASPVRFTENHAPAPYDRNAVERCWRALELADRALKRFRGQFVGKSSPVHFWWGGFDLACTRFSGRRAPQHPGGIPNLPDYVSREAYSHECISAGWWPGVPGSSVAEAAFYAYEYPEPAGYPEASVLPAAARYDTAMHLWVLPYEAVRTAPDPDAAIAKFLQSTYAAAAELSGWDRALLERPSLTAS